MRFCRKCKRSLRLPDGCYPNFTTAEGCNALQNLTTGAANSGVGWYSLFGTSTGNFNTGVGAGTLTLNNSDSNTAVGTAALLLNTAGLENSALGTAALVNNDNGDSNTAVGAFALQTNTNGGGNTAVGHGALQNSTGDFLTAIGANAGTDPDIVSNNVYIGDPGFPGDENVISIGGISASGIDFTATYVGGIYGAQLTLQPPPSPYTSVTMVTWHNPCQWQFPEAENSQSQGRQRIRSKPMNSKSSKRGSLNWKIRLPV